MEPAPATEPDGEPGRPAARSARLVGLIGLALALLLAHFVYRELLHYEHFGWDTYPMILTSRIAGFGDVLENFTRELMQGRYPLGSFYRPVTSLSFGLDGTLWDTAPFGFHLTNHAILLTGVVLAFLIARRIVGGAWAPPVAALTFALHPIHFALAPMAARRADMLSALFTMATLVALSRPGVAVGVGRAAAVFVLAYAAAASKETGIVVLPLAAGLVLLEASGGARERLRVLALRGGPVIAAVIVYVASRTLVVGGLGGHEGSSVSGALAASPKLLAAYGNLMVCPRAPLYGPWTLGALALALIAALLMTRARTGRAGLFCAWWFLLLAGITGLAGEMRTWYGAPFLPLYATTTALVASGAVWAASRARAGASALAALVALFLVASPLRHSGLFHHYVEWRELSEWESEFFDEARAGIESAAAGSVVDVGTLPKALRSDLANVRSVGLALYSVQAWADLSFPGARIRVVEGGQPSVDAGEIVLRARAGAPDRRR